jgi:SPP1 gp7 family putative phage head morphogenesis protein
MNLPALKSYKNIKFPKNSQLLAMGSFDPTRTLTLRNAFAKEMARRFRQLRGIINIALIEDDVLGLINEVGGFRILAELTSPGRRAFDFPRSGDKVAAFTQWLEKQQQAGLLEVTQGVQLGTAIEQAWTNKYINEGYKRGIQRARQQLVKGGHPVPPLSESGGIGVAFNQPFHLDRVGLLHTRVFNQLKGITSQMDTQVSSVLSQAMVEGKNPREIARLLNKTISGTGGTLELTDTLGRFIPAERRAKMLARTEVIRAHAQAQLQEFRNWRVAGVSVKAEFVTAGDERVCVICEGLEGQIFTLEAAEGLIPRHVQCRCTYIPLSVKD